ncbi:MAG: NAD(P)/FAD-dependent oxidoreductase [Clostridia bacterium]|nr:NAD(P)/FAD-dependent oxidoreductase [Clostridia bacterium]
MFDALVIGGGVIGGSIFRELTKYKGSFCLVEKEEDVAMGASRANSGIVHAGFDAKEGSLKAKFNVLGNKMMPKYCEDLGVKYRNNGSLVLGYGEEDYNTLLELKQRGERNGVENLSMLNRDELLAIEPNVQDSVTCALFAPTGGIVCPYELTLASIGNAMDNGGQLLCDFEVCKITKENGVFKVIAKDGREVLAKVVINCAGFYSAEVAKMLGDDTFDVQGRKGEYILLDRESGDFVSHTLFTAPTKAGKGVLVTQTVDNNILLGPTATEQGRSDSTITTPEGLGFVTEKVAKMCKNVPHFNTITSFAGVRAYCDRHDFIIEHSQKAEGLINCAGIESPGLTSAPAIAKYVVEDLYSKFNALDKNENFNGKREPDYFFKNLTDEEKNAVIAKDHRYGKMICRCEQITEGEIVRAIHENPPARSVSAVKRRTRAGMGRCQGGFCQAHVVEILARELGVSYEEITLSGKGSEIVVGKVK